MLLAIDIGNTNLVIGGIRDDQLLFKARIATDRLRTSDQYGVEIKNMIEAFGHSISEIDDCIISSVVPPVFNSVKTGVIKVIGKQPMVVGPGLKTGLNIHMDVPSQVGSDRIVIAVAALAEYSAPLILMDLGTAWFLYRSVSLFTPKWCGWLGMLPLFRADFLWMNTIILTETPFLLALTGMVYYTLRMGKQPGYRNFWPCAWWYMFGLMMKANIAPYPVFALVYLLVCRYDRKLLLKQCGVLAAVVLCFIIPWTIRNYVQFHAFVPLTYGAGNPTLLGTYQGVGYPADEDLDYVTNVEEPAREKYADYYDENGEVLPQYARYVALQTDGIKAAYRQQVWWDTDWKQMVYSYGVMKPQRMIESVFYWDQALDQTMESVQDLQRLDLYLCIGVIAASLALKKYRKPVLFATAVYLGNIYIYAMTYSFSRYNASLMSMRFLLIGLGGALLMELLRRGMDSLRPQPKRLAP